VKKIRTKIVKKQKTLIVVVYRGFYAIMAKMAEQEVWKLDDLLTHTDPELGSNGRGFPAAGKPALWGWIIYPSIT
jgi:hypothetical protein